MRSPKLLAQAGGYIGRYTVKHQPPPIQTENDLKASQDFEFFCGWLTRNKPTPLIPQEHMKPWIEAVLTGKDSRVLKGVAGQNINILSPRGSAKSSFLGMLVAWLIGRHAMQQIGLKILYISYNLETARAKSAAIKAMVDTDEYRSIFPCVRKSEKKWADDLWTIDYEYAGIEGIGEDKYTLKAAGITGSIVSKRCLIKGTLVTTELGDIPIEELGKYVGIGLNILSYNHETGQTEWKPLTAFEKSYSSDIVRVKTNSGRELQCTADHDIYTLEHGYRNAGDLLPGDTLISLTKSRELSPLRSVVESEEQRSSLSSVLEKNKNYRFPNRMCRVQESIFSRQKKATVQTENQNRKVCLLQGMSFYSQSKEIYGQKATAQDLLYLSGTISTNPQRTSLLFTDLFGQSSFGKNEREREQQLQRWVELSKGVQKYASSYLKKGWLSLCSLWNRRKEDERTARDTTNQSCSTPYQRYNTRESARKPNNSLSLLSHESSSNCGTDSISSVACVSAGSIPVYDIEVADNHNFFALGILTHNCSLVIFDDLIKNADDIGNPEVRTKMERNYSQAILPTLFEGGRMLGVGTRFRGDDIHCTQFIPDKGWHVIEQEAILKDDEGNERSYWEEFWSLNYLQAMRAADPLMFQYQYQNKIGQVSQIALSTSWIRFGEPPTQFDSMGIGVDLAASQKERSCYSVFTLIGKVANQFWILDYRRGRWVGNMEKCKEILDLYANWVEPDCFHPSLLDDELGEYTYHSELNRWTHPNQANRLTDSNKDATINKDGKVIYLPNAQNSLIPYIPTPKTPWRIFVEKAAYQISMKGDLQLFLHQQKGLEHIAITPLLLKGDKMGHLISISGGYSSGMVIYNKYVDWTEYNKEFTEFGVAAYCDCVDSAALALKGLGMRQKLDSAIDQLQVILGHGQQVG